LNLMGIGAAASGVILIALGLVLVFLGRKLVKMLFFLVGGVMGALLTLRLAPLPPGTMYPYIAAAVGFIAAGLIFYFLLPFAAGLLAGLAAFLILRPIVADLWMVIMLSLAAAILVATLFNKLLTVGTAFLGALIFLAGLNQIAVQSRMEVSEPIQLALLAILTALGSYIQFKT